MFLNLSQVVKRGLFVLNTCGKYLPPNVVAKFRCFFIFIFIRLLFSRSNTILKSGPSNKFW